MELRKQEVQGKEEVCSCRGSAIGGVVLAGTVLPFLHSIGVQAKASDGHLAVSDLLKLRHRTIDVHYRWRKNLRS